jgi:hypothetical protein
MALITIFIIQDKMNQLVLNRLLAQTKLQDLSSLYVPVETKHLINRSYFPLLNIVSSCAISIIGTNCRLGHRARCSLPHECDHRFRF